MINTYLDLSTCHLTQETIKLLGGTAMAYMTDPDLADRIAGRGPGPACTIAVYPHGLFITVPPKALDGVPQDFSEVPEDLAKVWDYAYSLGCWLVRFDADGSIIDLPTYDWS